MQHRNSRISDQSESELNFFDLLRILLDSKKFIFLFTIAATAIGFIYSNYLVPLPSLGYQASVVMEVGSHPAKENERDTRSSEKN